MNNSSCAPTCIDLRDRQHNKWGPRQCQIACVVRNLLLQQLCGTVTVSEASAVEEYLSNKTVHPAVRAQLHLPPLDLSWALMHTEVQARSKHTSQKVIAEQVVSPDMLFNLAARHFHIRKLTQLPLQINPWCCHLYNCLFPSTNMLYFCVLRTFFN